MIRNLLYFLAALALANPAIAAGPHFSNSGGIGAASCTLSGGEWTGGSCSWFIDGMTGISSFAGVGITASAHPFTSDFFYAGDNFAASSNLTRTTDTATGSGVIQFDSLIDNIVSSNRTGGPAQASVGLGVRSIKPDFLTSTSTQEADGLYIQTKTGIHGDTATILADAAGISGGNNFINIMEGSVILFNPVDASIDKEIRYQAASFDQAHSSSFGLNLWAEKGVIDNGILLSSTSASDYFTNFVIGNRNNVTTWTVDSNGNEALAGSVAAAGLLVTANNSPILMSNAAHTANINILNLDASGNLQVGSGVSGQVVVTPPIFNTAGYMQQHGITFSALPACVAGAAGIIAFITDASAAITAWHQQVTAGGGANKAFIACNGSGWFAFDY